MIPDIKNIFGFTGESKSRLFLLISIFMFLIREAGVILFFVINGEENTYSLIWKASTTFLFLFSAILSISYKTIFESNIEIKTEKDRFIPELSRLSFTLLGMLGFYAFIKFSNLRLFLKFSMFGEPLPQNLYTLLISGLFSFAIVTVSLYLLYFIYKWFMIFRNRRTKKYLKLVTYMIFYFTFIYFLRVRLEIDFNFIVNVLNTLIFFGTGLFVWLLLEKHSWIASLERLSKIKITFISILAIIVTSLILFSIYADESFAEHALNNFFGGSYGFLSMIFYFGELYFIRIFWISLVSIPTSSLVERRTTEITSLAYLNKFVTESVDKDISHLIKTVTTLALNSCQANIAWTEIYDENKVRHISTENIDKNVIDDIHSNRICHAVLANAEKPLLIQSVPEDKELYLLLYYIPNAMSLMAIPIFSGNEKIGILVVINEEEFGFEKDDINVLAAFSDNLRLALENARLFRDSIEKQRYQNEMMLARDIQQKLLPQKLPELENFNLSAFSIPATEVGGDYYDIIKLSDGRLCIIIADVSGKGLSAAFYMAQLKGIVLSLDGRTGSPSELLKTINATLFGNMERQMYITMSCVALDNFTGKIKLSRAGHMPFFVKTGSEVKILIPKGLGIGLMGADFFNKHIEEIEFTMSSGDTCLLFTDGINELKNSRNEQFGYEPIKHIMLNSNNTSRNFIEALKHKLDNYGIDAEQHDDMTAVAVSYQQNLEND